MILSSTMKQFVQLIILQGLNFLVPIVTFPLLARRLSPDNFGVYSVVQAVIIFGSVINDFGYSTYGSRNIAVSRGNNTLMMELIRKAFSLKISISIFTFGAGLSILLSKFGSDFGLHAVLILALCGASGAFNGLWFFQGLEKIRRYNLVYIFWRLFSLFLVYFFIRSPGDLVLSVYLSIVPGIAISIYSVRYLYLSYKFTFAMSSVEEMLKEFKEGWNYFIPSAYSIILTSSGVMLLGLQANSTAVGGYAAVERFIKAIASLNGSVNQLAYPKVAGAMAVSSDSGWKTLKYFAQIFMTLSVMATLIILFYGKAIFTMVFGSDYQEYVKIITLISPYILLSTANTFVGTLYLTTTGRQRMYASSFGHGAIVSLIFYTLGIHYFGYSAAGAGLVVGESVILASALFGLWSERGES